MALLISFPLLGQEAWKNLQKSYNADDFYLGCRHSDKTFYYYFKLELNLSDQTFMYCSLYEGDQNKDHKDMYDVGHFSVSGDTLILNVDIRRGRAVDFTCDTILGYRIKGNELIALKESYPWRCMRFRLDLKETREYFSKVDIWDRNTWKKVNKRIRKFKKKMRKQAERALKK